MAYSTSINPATGKEIASYERLSALETNNRIAEASYAHMKWRAHSIEERARFMNRLADIMEENEEEYAQLATAEMGKIITQARAEIQKCAKVCRYYADHAKNLLADEEVTTEGHKSFVTYQPLGAILAIMPWNFPFYQVIRFAAPTLMAGNTGLIKHASNVQGCAKALEDAFLKAGFPKGVFINLNVSSSEMEEVVANPIIKAVTLTGSDPAGRAVAKVAGESLKKTVLELGGSDAYIVMADADLDKTTELATFGRLQNNGQTCIAAKRFIVDASIYDAFLEFFKAKMASKIMGEPAEEEVYYGPMAREDLRNELHEQVQQTIKQGGRLVLGGKIPNRVGAYYPAAILADLKPGMEGFDEELFGPVASVIKSNNVEHAIELANNSQFGLGSGVITTDLKKGEAVARRLEAGSSFVNKLVVSDPRLPFGGIKNSGYGRELGSNGIREFVNIKTIWVDEL